MPDKISFEFSKTSMVSRLIAIFIIAIPFGFIGVQMYHATLRKYQSLSTAQLLEEARSLPSSFIVNYIIAFLISFIFILVFETLVYIIDKIINSLFNSKKQTKYEICNDLCNKNL